MGSNCADSTVIPTLNGTLLNHHHMTSIAYWHQELGNQMKALGVQYSLGETNSISVSPPHITSFSTLTQPVPRHRKHL